MDKAQWPWVLFTDESRVTVLHGSACPSRFSLSFKDGRIRVWRRAGECLYDVTVMEDDGYADGTVMMWADFEIHQRTPLHCV